MRFRPSSSGVSRMASRCLALSLTENRSTTAAESGPQFRYGNSARNTVIGPGIINFDASINKKFTVSESKYVEFRTEIFNLPNHPIWSPPGRTLRNPDYGVINSTRIDSRQIQFALKVVF